MGIAWVVYLGALLGGLVGALIHVVRTRRAEEAQSPPYL
jgi:hypothetical protein